MRLLRLISNEGNGSGNSNNNSSKLVIHANGLSYECIGKTGKGSFGVVYKAIALDSSRAVVAIKRVLQDVRYKVTPLSCPHRC